MSEMGTTLILHVFQDMIMRFANSDVGTENSWRTAEKKHGPLSALLAHLITK